MPIAKHNLHHYRTPEYLAAKAAVIERARGRCECRGECGSVHDSYLVAPTAALLPDQCGAPNGVTVWRELDAAENWDTRAGSWSRPVRIVLTVAHIDHSMTNHDLKNLMHRCQLCHLRLDRHQHAATAKRTRQQRIDAACLDLPLGDKP